MLSVSMPLARPEMTFLVPYILLALELLVPLIDAIMIHSLQKITSGVRSFFGLAGAGPPDKVFLQFLYVFLSTYSIIKIRGPHIVFTVRGKNL